MSGQPLYTAVQVRELDRRAIEDYGIDGYTLMCRAGRAVLGAVRARFPEARRLLVCCGGGNNGGDGYVVARLAEAAGLQVGVYAQSPPERLSGDARRAYRDWKSGGGSLVESPEAEAVDVIVDALLGTGLDREVRDDYAALIGRINAAGPPVIAVDVPSGLSADTGMPLGTAVRADVTVTFIGRKRGLETGRAADFVGELRFDALQTPESIHQGMVPDAWRVDADFPAEVLPLRMPSTHKGDLGHVLVCGGDHGMSGACLLAARASLVAGSGLVSVATRGAHAAILAAALPEAMWSDGEDGDRLDALVARADTIALGPGLGRSEWSRSVVQRLFRYDGPLVVDADALNLLAESPLKRDEWVLTPHPGEAARLLDCGVDEIQGDRFAAVREIAARYRAVAVLKGAGSLIADADGEVAVCPFGTPAMATAGMGDALTGVIASLLGQGVPAYPAACAGVVLHARAGEAAAAGRRSILAGELIDALSRVLP